MSERKTAEIKFRIAPSEKAAWQADADTKGISLSELIREKVNAPAFGPVEPGNWIRADRQGRPLEAPEVTMLDPDEPQFKTVLSDTSLAMRPYELKSWMFKAFDG